MHDGCRCSECYGLAEWLEENGLDTRGLPPAPGHQPLTPILKDEDGTIVEIHCNGSMTCSCPKCEGERAALVRRGVRETSTSLPLRRAA